MTRILLNKKQAQAGNSAAILVIIIAVLLILFILAISPEERDELLDGTEPNTGTDPAFPNSITLFRANPGNIKYMPQNERLHEFAPFNIKADRQGGIIHTQNALYLKTSSFERITETITFQTTPNLTNNVLLNFNIERASGSLLIKLNGETIFNAPLQQGNAPPISIAASNLKPQNKLTFEVSGPGAAFWRYNQYSIKDINIYGDVLDLTQSKATQVFNIDRQEINELETSTLRYLPACRAGNIKEVRIELNNFQIFNGIPDCEIFNTIPIPTNYLIEGVNDISFQIREGQILVDRARILNTLDEPDITTYYFEVRDRYFTLNEDEYELSPMYEAMLDMTFPNTNQKRFELIINGKPINFNTARQRETRNLQLFLEPGTNSIEIHPKSPISITEIKVRIREK
ncbi:MAG: hypothetical protein ACLFN8_03745 [Candidatus Woesearchaeota archaeon]